MNKYDLPLKIIHGIDYPSDMPFEEIERRIKDRLVSLKEKGFGGVVTNVADRNYTLDEHLWHVLCTTVKCAGELDMRVWLYDEKGYPSGGAGGMTVDEDPDRECRGAVMLHAFIKAGESHTFEFPRGHEYALSAASWLVDSEDISRLDSDLKYRKYEVYGKREDLTVVNDSERLMFAAFFVKKHVYEGTHAEHNVCESRRYVDITNTEAIGAFIKNTYKKYTEHLGSEFAGRGGVIEAMFTDEPSLMGVYINAGLYPRAIHDEYDDTLPLYPLITWGRSIENRMETEYGIDILDDIIYLFASDTPKARDVRLKYYTALSRLAENAYFRQLSDYCHSVGLPFSGHILLEDDIRLHPQFEGNFFSLLRHMHYPGIDMLHSVPEIVYDNAFTPKLVSSVAEAYGREHVMSEVSAHAQGGKASPEEMMSSMLIQYAFGVDVFTSYYFEDLFPVDKYREYNAVIGKVSETMKGKKQKRLLLYYPIETVQALHTPYIEGLNKDGESRRLADLCWSELKCAQDTLLDSAIGFDYIDSELIEGCKVKEGRIITPRGGEYDALVIPFAIITDKLRSALESLISRGAKVISLDDSGISGVSYKNANELAELAKDAARGLYYRVETEGKTAVLVSEGDYGKCCLIVNAENREKTAKISSDRAYTVNELYTGKRYEASEIKTEPYGAYLLTENK